MGSSDSVTPAHFKLYVLYQREVGGDTYKHEMLLLMDEYVLTSLTHR